MPQNPNQYDSADPPAMTYGEFVKRRTAILAEITALQRKFAGLMDPAYTMLSPNGPHIVDLQLQNARERLTMLVAAWELQQRRGHPL